MDIRLRPISLSVFTTIFIAIFLILLFSLGRITYQEVAKLDSQFLAANTLRAEGEIRTALDNSLQTIEYKTQQLANWEETVQQLANPTYDTNRYRHRAKDNRLIADHTLELALYDQNGSVLSDTDTSLLPDKIDINDTTAHIVINEYEPLVMVIKPIHKEPSQDNLGYIATLNRLRPVFYASHHFSLIDPKTLSIDIRQAEQVSSSVFIKHLHYQLSDDPYTEAVQSAITSSLLRLAHFAVILTLLIFPLAALLMSRPIMRLSQHIDKLKQSPYRTVSNKIGRTLFIKELDKIRESLNAYHNDLNLAYTNLDEKDRELHDLAHHDPLTGAMNRKAFNDFRQEVNNIFQYSHKQISLLLFDINHFKALNDTYGHQAGDEVLIAISQAINNILSGQEKLFRIGGDEFATILIDSNPRKARQIAKQCHVMISQLSFEKIGILEPVRMSIGLANTSPKENSSIDTLQWKADVAIHFAKRPGNPNIVSFSSELAQNVQGLFSNRTHSALFKAISNGTGLIMHYQPIVTLSNGEVQYYEALIRIQHEGQLIMPSHIFPLVEARSLELDLDRQVIQKVVADIKNGVIPLGTGVSINLSAPSIVDSELIKWLTELKPFINNYKLLIEVTETALITKLQTARKNLGALREMGFRIALDDFGSGYSSLRYLGAMPVDVVKFDITLVRLINSKQINPILNHLAQMIIESGHLLVAEGIETKRAAQQLNKLGFHYGQGYYFGKPDATIPPTQLSRNIC
jgi:diguanylate cyclase (GGDEF)-like protein